MRLARRQLLVQQGRINKMAHRCDSIGWDADAASMLTNGLFVRSKVDTIHFVFSYIAMQPLDLGPHQPDLCQRSHRQLVDLRLGHQSGARNLAFNDKLLHDFEV
jgi:hypothetical protein